MNTHKEFAEVDFAQPEVIASLARAYAVILNTEHQGAPPAPQSKEPRKQKPAVVQKRALVQRFRRLFLAGMPETHSKMQPLTAKAKYYKRFHSLTDVEITSHIEGQATFAAPLIGRDGFTREVALDIDAGGEEAIRAGLAIAAAQELTAYGLVSQAVEGGHTGGHIRLPLSDVAVPERARLLAEQLRVELMQRTGLAENTIEVYPTRKGLRLPFGVHTHTGKRGLLLLQDGTRLDLDAGELLTTMSQAMTLIEALSPTNPDRLPMLSPESIRNGPVSPPNALQRPKSGSPIQDYNQRTNLLDWLISIGARVASTTRQCGYLLHCPCTNHKHHDAHPSLEVQPARNSRYGAYVIIGHAASCRFATQRGRISDAFDAYCRWYGVSTREALDRLYPDPR